MLKYENVSAKGSANGDRTLKQLDTCKDEKAFLEKATEIIVADPTAATINKVYRSAARNRRLQKPADLLRRIDDTRKGVSKLRQNRHTGHVAGYVRVALNEGKTCPDAYLKAI